jgi:alkylated DNA repair dioxygenase AlkB
MNSLFPEYPVFPQGFFYFPDFITREEEVHLVENIKKEELQAFLFQGFEAKRKSASFGFDYHFDKRQLSKGKEIPQHFHTLIAKVAHQLHVEAEKFAELLLLEYPPGSVINWHRDAPPFDLIAGISLLTDCTFRLRPHDKEKQHRKAILSFPVRARSLYCIQGEARSNWQHSIAPVSQTRYSVTLRTLRS